MRPNSLELSGPLSTSIIHQVLHKLGRISGPIQRVVRPTKTYNPLITNISDSSTVSFPVRGAQGYMLMKPLRLHRYHVA